MKVRERPISVSVAGEHAMHHSADCVLLALDQQVNVIRHQAKGVEMSSGRFTILALTGFR